MKMSDNNINKNKFDHLKHQKKKIHVEKMSKHQLLNTSAGLGLVKKEEEEEAEDGKGKGQREPLQAHIPKLR